MTKMADEPVFLVEATVKNVGKYISGKSARGDYSFQSVIITDGRDEFRAVFKDRKELPRNVEGKKLQFLAHHGDRGWTGLKMKMDENYKTKEMELVLWVTGTAQVVGAPNAQDDAGGYRGDNPPQDDGGYQSDPEPPRQQAPARPPQAPTQSRPSSPPSAPQSAPQAAREPENRPSRQTLTHEQAIIAAKKHIGQNRNVYLLCMRAARSLCMDFSAETGIPVNEDDFRSVAASFFIQFTRNPQQWHVIDSMPCDDLAKYAGGAPRAAS